MAYDVNTDLILGDKLFIFIDNQPVAFSTSCSLEIQSNTVSTTNKMGGKWDSSLSGKLNYTVSTDALYTAASGSTSFDTLMTKMISGTTVDFVLGTAVDTTYVKDKGMYQGKAFVTSLSLKADNGAVASCSISLTGTGPLTKAV